MPFSYTMYANIFLNCAVCLLQFVNMWYLLNWQTRLNIGSYFGGFCSNFATSLWTRLWQEWEITRDWCEPLIPLWRWTITPERRLMESCQRKCCNYCFILTEMGRCSHLSVQSRCRSIYLQIWTEILSFMFLNLYEKNVCWRRQDL